LAPPVGSPLAHTISESEPSAQNDYDLIVSCANFAGCSSYTQSENKRLKAATTCPVQVKTNRIIDFAKDCCANDTPQLRHANPLAARMPVIRSPSIHYCDRPGCDLSAVIALVIGCVPTAPSGVPTPSE
jgi:hypothetical protein